MWQGLKTQEFRRRYLKGRPTTWCVYLTAPVSTLTAVIDLDEAVAGSPRSHSPTLPSAPTPGTGESGRTHLSIGLGIRPCLAGHRVAFATAAEWVARLADAHHAGKLQAELVKLGRIPR